MKKYKSLKFKCKLCNECCKTNGRVYLYQPDFNKIPLNLKISTESFFKKYCEFRRETFVFADQTVYFEVFALSKNSEDNSCVFLDGNRCKIHPNKPIQCFLAPFIKPIVTDYNVWRLFRKNCKGFGEGKIYKYEEIVNTLNRFNNERSLYHQWIINNEISLEKATRLKLKDPLKIVTYLKCKKKDYHTSSNALLDQIFEEF